MCCKNPNRGVSLILLLVACTVFGIAASSALAQQTIYLKNGDRIEAYTVHVNDRTGRVWGYGKIVPGKATSIRSLQKGRPTAPIGQRYDYSWDELADESVKKFFPERWRRIEAERQAQRSQVNPPPAAWPPPAQQVQPKLPPLPYIPPPAKAAGVSDAGGNVAVRAVNLTRHGEKYLFEAEVVNISDKTIFDVRAILHTADSTIAEGADVASSLEAGAKGASSFRILLPASFDPLKDNLLLDIKCYDQPQSSEDRKASYYSFKVKQVAAEQYTVVPAD